MAETQTIRSVPMVDLQGQYKKIKSEIDQAFQEVLDSCWFINGAPVRDFAANLASYLDVAQVIPCANGTDALQVALMALDLQPGDEVITTPFTFVSTAEVIALLRLKPVFVDVHPDTFNMDETQLEEVITERSRCIIPVHLFGQGANMEAIMDIAERHNLYVVEDNAQAIGADFRFSDGRVQKFGTIGHIGCTSFFPSKNLGAYGDAGALFTNDPKLGESIHVIVNHGSKERYYHESIGVNSRLDTLQAVVLDIKLKHLPEYNRARQEAADYYNQQLAGIVGLRTPVKAPFSTHVYHQYTLKFEQGRDAVRDYLTKHHIASGVYYPVPLHLQAAYRGESYKQGAFPVSEALSEQVLSLPMHTELDRDTQDYIVEHIQAALGSLD